MRNYIVVLVSFLFVFAVSVPSVTANPQGQAVDKPAKECDKAKKKQCSKDWKQKRQEMKKKKHAFKKEMSEIQAETFALLKEIAPDKSTKKKAEELEGRYLKHLEEKKAFYKEMAGKKGAHGKHDKHLMH